MPCVTCNVCAFNEFITFFSFFFIRTCNVMAVYLSSHHSIHPFPWQLSTHQTDTFSGYLECLKQLQYKFTFAWYAKMSWNKCEIKRSHTHASPWRSNYSTHLGTLQCYLAVTGGITYLVVPLMTTIKLVIFTSQETGLSLHLRTIWHVK